MTVFCAIETYVADVLFTVCYTANIMKRLALLFCIGVLAIAPAAASAQSRRRTCRRRPTSSRAASPARSVRIRIRSSYLPLTLYGQDVRMAYMDVPPPGTPNGHTVVLLHGNNFAGFYFGGPIDALRKEGFRVDRAGSDRLRPIVEADHSLQLPRHGAEHDARSCRASKHRQGDDRRPLDGRHARGALRDAVSRTSPSGWCSTTRSASSTAGSIGRGTAPTRCTSGRSRRHTRPFARASCATSRTTRRRGTPEFESYTRIRYAWTLSADWPRLAMVQTLLSQVQYLDPVVDDWAHIKAPTLVFGGAEDMLPGSAAVFQERMKFIADTIPNGNAQAACCFPASATCRTSRRRRRRIRRSLRF